MTEITWKDTGIDSIAKMRGKKVAVWLAGNEHKLFAALEKNGIDPQEDVTIVNQPFTMDLFLNREVDAAAAMTYNELAQVLEAENPETDELYQLDDLNVIKFEDIGIGALEDGLFVREDWIQSEENQDIAKRFLKATFRGWIHCRDNPDECVDFVLESGSTLGEGHQRWMMNEVNALIWPAPRGIGVMDPAAFQRTVDIVSQFKVVKTRPNATAAYRTDLAQAAVDELKEDDVDVTGTDWEKEEIEVTPGGK
jgi:NitT/TauT family transport system substrate-binding protein